MKTKLHHVIFVFTLFLASVNSYAQDNNTEGDYPNSNSNANAFERGDNDPVLYTGGESDSRVSKPTIQQTARDSASVRTTPMQSVPRTTKPVTHDANKPQSPDDESILSFNFLYYIIQKFKFQDIMD